MTSHIRGDDDVLALLDEMTGGGSVSLTSSNDDLHKTDVDDATQKQHDSNNNKALATLLSAYKLSPPTNIHVEIIRHRAHEKFKSNFYELFRNCVASHQSQSSTSSNNMNSSTTNKDDIRNQCIRSTINKLWKSMPVHSIWERFQFTLKTCEADCVREVHNQQSNFIQPWCSTSANMSNEQLLQHLVNPSIHEIQAYILHGRNNGTIWEPLLPVSTISTSSTSSTTSGHHDEINQKYKQTTLQLLQEEIKFQMRRTFKQLIGPGSGRSSKQEALSLDKLYDTLVNEEDMTTDDGKKRNKKKKKSKKRKDKHMNRDNTVNKEECILQTIYKSTSFTKLTNKLHKKFMYLAEDSYNTNFINELNKCCNRLLMEEQNHGGGGMSKKKKRKRKSSSNMPKITIVENDNKNDTSGSRKTDNQQRQQQLMVSFQGISLRINQVHKNKLYSMYQHTLSTLLPGEIDNNHMIDEHLQQFPKILFTILLRYDALEGAGLQSAIPSLVFDYLNSRFGCNFECFASPFNCWLEEESISSSNGNSSSSSLVRGGNFGSVFADTDALFGSRGSFFGMDFVKMTVGEDGGCFQANPPFASEFIQRMCNYMHRFLGDSKEEKTVPLMFVIFVPAWSESVGWKTLSSSPHLTKHILLSQKDDVHYYSEGTQHRRTLDNGGSYRIASFDTSVFFLQNGAAKKKWPLLEDSDDETMLKAAFAMNTLDEKKVVVKKIDTQKKKKTNPKSSVKAEELAEKQQPRDSSATAISDKQKKRKKKHKQDQGSSKKRRLISDANDEMSILQSMGILNDSVVSKVEKTGSSGKKKKRRNKR